MTNFDNHISITSCYDINKICKPLEKIGTTFFSYSRLYSDNSQIYLLNNSDFAKNYLTNLYNGRYLENFQFECSVADQNLFINIEMYPDSITFMDAREIFSLKYGFFLTQTKKHYKEICYFGTTHDSPLIYNYYLNNKDILIKFKNYFVEQTSGLIKQAEKNKHKAPIIIDSDSIINNYSIFSENVNEQILNTITPNKIYLPNDPDCFHLTAREYECVQWIIKGKTAEEIAMIIGLSSRTIEKYLENLKIKFNCTKISQLIYKLAKLGLDLD